MGAVRQPAPGLPVRRKVGRPAVPGAGAPFQQATPDFILCVPGEDLVLAADNGNGMAVWDSRRGRLAGLLAPEIHVAAMAISADGNTILTAEPPQAGNDKATLSVLDRPTGKTIRSWSTDDRSYETQVAVTPDGELAVTCGYNGVTVWRVSSGQRDEALSRIAGDEWTTAMTISPDGKEAGLHDPGDVARRQPGRRQRAQGHPRG